MNYIVFDLEWNQSGTGKEEDVVPGMPFEIVEVGAVKLGQDGEMLGQFNELIRPQVYLEMHKITGKLIHLNMEMLQKGDPFQTVVDRFEKWCGSEEFLYCTWGTLDLMELQRNRKYYNMTPLSDGPIAYLDVQKLFALTYDQLDRKKRRSLSDAVEYLNLQKKVPFHRAYADAYYTAEVLKCIMKRDSEILRFVSYDNFYPPVDRKHEIRHQFDTYFKYVSREFPGKTELLADREVASSKCYLCHKNLRKKIRWFTANNKHYYCLAYCETHGYLKGKIRVHRTADGGNIAVKTTKLISEEEAQQIRKRWEHQKNAASRRHP